MNLAVYNITGPALFPMLSVLVFFEVIGILIEAGVVIFFFRRWRTKMTSLRLIGIVALANIASLFIGWIVVIEGRLLLG